MTYKLLATGTGILIDRTSIFSDVKGSAELSFLLPDNGQYAVIFVDNTGFCIQVQVKNCKAELPQELLKTQTLQVYAVKIAPDGTLEQTFACEPLLIRSLGELRKSVFEINGTIKEEDVRLRLADIEQKFCTQVQNYEKAVVEVKQQRERYNVAVENYNAAIDTINRLSERLIALEANYDPTVIQ